MKISEALTIFGLDNELVDSDKGSANDEYKKIYRKLSLKCHPDKGGSAEEFGKLTDAYKVLTEGEITEGEELDDVINELGSFFASYFINRMKKQEVTLEEIYKDSHNGNGNLFNKVRTGILLVKDHKDFVASFMSGDLVLNLNISLYKFMYGFKLKYTFLDGQKYKERIYPADETISNNCTIVYKKPGHGLIKGRNLVVICKVDLKSFQKNVKNKNKYKEYKKILKELLG